MLSSRIRQKNELLRIVLIYIMNDKFVEMFTFNINNREIVLTFVKKVTYTQFLFKYKIMKYVSLCWKIVFFVTNKKKKSPN